MDSPAGALEFCDAHFHPQDERLQICCVEWLREARSTGVAQAVANGTGPDDWDRVTDLCQRHRPLLPAYGLHPWKVSNAPHDWCQQLEQKLETGACCVGEIGLDRWIENPDVDAQIRAFRWQWEAAFRYGLPATIHCLRAWGLLLEQLKGLKPLPRGFLLHSYGGSPELIDEMLPHGAWFSFSASILHPRKEKARASFLKVPIDRLLLETDAPDMLPPEAFCYGESHVSGLHHPASLRAFYERASEMRGMPMNDFAQQILSNFRRFFCSAETAGDEAL